MSARGLPELTTQVVGLKTRGMCLLPILEAGSPQSQCQQGPAFSKGTRGDCVPWRLQALLACGCGPAISDSIFTAPPLLSSPHLFSYRCTFVGLRAHSNPG